MTVDPSDPETFENEDRPGDEDVTDVEAPAVDAAQQRADVIQERDDPLTDVDPASANEADAAEQARVVSLDEDDYR